MGFKKLANEGHELVKKAVTIPYMFVKHQIEQGADNSSFLARLILAGESTAEEKSNNMWACLSLYVAGLDTVSLNPLTPIGYATPHIVAEKKKIECCSLEFILLNNVPTSGNTTQSTRRN